jgi:outer membrane protein TolC
LSLITFQRARRAYMAASDQVEFQVRQDLRLLRALNASFEISRQQLLSAAQQYDFARMTLLGPRDRRTANDTTTLNLLNALSALLAARNGLSASFINFEQQRVQLLLDLEELQLDQRGFPVNVHRPRNAPPELLPDLGGAVRLGAPAGLSP